MPWNRLVPCLLVAELLLAAFFQYFALRSWEGLCSVSTSTLPAVARPSFVFTVSAAGNAANKTRINSHSRYLSKL